MEMEFDPIPVTYEVACQAAINQLSTNGADLSKLTELAF